MHCYSVSRHEGTGPAVMTTLNRGNMASGKNAAGYGVTAA